MRIYERKNILERNINYSNAYGRNLLKLEVFEEISWLDKDQNPCLDNYYHTFFYRIDEQGRIVRLRKGKIVPYKYNHSDHAYDSYLKAAHKRFALQFTPYSERHMK